MTERMRETLESAAKSPIRRVHEPGPARPAWPFPAGSLAALRRRGLVDYTELRSRQGNFVQEWRINEAGKQALRPPKLVGTERPVFMARGSGTTSERAMAIDDAEVMGAPSGVWLRVSREKRAAAEDPRKVAGKLARSLRAA